MKRLTIGALCAVALLAGILPAAADQGECTEWSYECEKTRPVNCGWVPEPLPPYNEVWQCETETYTGTCYSSTYVSGSTCSERENHSHYSATVTCDDGSRASATSHTSTSAARRLARAKCPTYTETVTCDDGSRQSATASTPLGAQAAAYAKCPTYSATVTCDDGSTQSATSTVSESAARTAARAKCPTYSATVTCDDGSTQSATSTVSESAARTAARAKCPTYSATVTCDDGSRQSATSTVSESAARTAARAKCPTYSATVTCDDGSTQSATSTVSESAARTAAQDKCPTYNETVTCDDGSSQSATASTPLGAQAAARAKCPTYSATVTCDDGSTQSATSTVSESAARTAAQDKCPTYNETVTCDDGSSQSATASTPLGAQAAARAKCPTYSATVTCDDGSTQSATSTVSESAARTAAQDKCPTYNETVTCDDGSSQSATASTPLGAQAAAHAKCPTYSATVTCDDGSTQSATSTVSESAARTAAQDKCPTYNETVTCDDGSSQSATASTPLGAQAAAHAKCPTYSTTVTCDDGSTQSATSTVSESAARTAAQDKCPTYNETVTCDDGSSQSATASTPLGAIAAAHAKCPTYSTTVTCDDGSTQSATSTVSESAARTAAQAKCPTYTETVTCDDGSSQSATASTPLGAIAAAHAKCPTYSATVTCDDGSTQSATSTVSESAARTAAQDKCPTYNETVTCDDHSMQTATASTPLGAIAAAHAKCPTYSATVTCDDGSTQSATSTVSESAARTAAQDKCPTYNEPAIPGGLSATPRNGRVDLSWAAADGATGYEYRYREAERSWPDESDGTSTSTSVMVPGLTNGTPHFFQVRATNSGGRSDWSATAKATPRPPRPATPGGLSATSGNGQVDLSWAAADRATAYEYRYREAKRSWPDQSDGISTSTSVTVPGLTNGTPHFFQVRATNSGGKSGWSATARATPRPPRPATPGVPTATPGNGQVDLSWAAADGATGYEYRYREAERSWPDQSDGISTSTSVTVPGLTNGTPHFFQVRATNSGGKSGWSATAKATPLNPVCDCPDCVIADIDGNGDPMTRRQCDDLKEVAAIWIAEHPPCHCPECPADADPGDGDRVTPQACVELRASAITEACTASGGFLETRSSSAGRSRRSDPGPIMQIPICIEDVAPTGPAIVPNRSHKENDPVNFTLPEGSKGNGTLFYSLSPLPTGVKFDGSLRTASGTIDTEQTETLTVTYKIVDNDQNSGPDDIYTVTFAWMITAIPELNALSDETNDVGDKVNVRMPAAFKGSGTYSIIGTLPRGLSFDASSRLVHGKVEREPNATYAKVHDLTYRVEDEDGAGDEEEFQWTIYNSSPVLAPVQNMVSPAMVELTKSFPPATGGNPPLTYEIDLTEIPRPGIRCRGPIGHRNADAARYKQPILRGAGRRW